MTTRVTGPVRDPFLLFGIATFCGILLLILVKKLFRYVFPKLVRAVKQEDLPNQCNDNYPKKPGFKEIFTEMNFIRRA